MKGDRYLFDTHAFIFWNNREVVSEAFVIFFDSEEQRGTLHLSSISFWEMAFLVKKKRMEISDLHAWRNELMNNINIHIIDPSPTEMIDSTLLPDHHKDPFDRLLIAQANHQGLILVTQDRNIQKYDVKHVWKE